MKVAACTLALSSGAVALTAPVVAPRAGVMRMAAIEDLPGVGPETGNKVWDPLGLSATCPYGSKEFEWLRTAEIKHGRVAMAASVGWIISEMGIHFPGYISKSSDLTFEQLGTGLAAWDAVPAAGKAQIFAAAGVIEAINEFKKPHYLKGGMIKYDGPKAKGRLSELKNGRLAMIAVASFYSESIIDGSVPGLPSTWQ